MLRRILVTAVLIFLISMNGSSGPSPSNQEFEDDSKLKEKAGSLSSVEGWIVFDSRRGGQFDLYKMRPDGSQVTRLTDTPESETNPDWSPDGRRIVFARKEVDDDDSSSKLYVMDADGGNEIFLTKRGTAPQFAPDGRAIIFERDRVDILKYEFLNRRVSRLTPPSGAPTFKNYMVKPRLSPDGNSVAFISDKKGRWNSWVMDMSGNMEHISRGCEPTWHPDGKTIFFIQKTRYPENSIWIYDWAEGSVREYLSLDGTYRHVYFPSVSNDGKYLLFSACPGNEHDHSSANYQVFIKEIEGGQPIRLSWNEYTERWPRLFVTAH